MMRFKLPPAEGKPFWGGLFFFFPMLSVFLGPYSGHGDATAWTIATVGFVVFLAFALLGLMYWSRKDVLLRVCIAMTMLETLFAASQYHFAALLVVVAVFAPFSVNGRYGPSAVWLAALVLVLYAQSWFVAELHDTWTFLLVAGPTLWIGAGCTLMARQQFELARANRVAERERIARDMHDVLGHTLSAIALKSELAGKLFEHDPERARSEIDDVERISREALSEVREVIHGYHAGDLRREFERAASLLKAAGVAVDWTLDAGDVPAMQERVLIFALREATTNIVRHAQARHCRIRLHRADGIFRLEIRDDGRGGINGSGLGLRGMRHRVEMLGGSLSWISNPGFELTVMLPVLREN